MTSAPVPPTSAPIKSLLRGRAFYESIGSPKFVVAPMVDQSEFAWRMLTRSFLTPEENSRMLAYTPMFHARLFGDAANAKYRDQHLQTSVTADLEPVLPTTPEVAAETKPYLDGNPTFDRPLFVQFCANDPDHLLSAAKLAAPYCDAIDLNLGCPQGIARKGHYGAFLQEDQELVHRLIRTLHEGDLGVPVTAKIRILGTKADTLRYAQNVLSAGASIITVHGRRREQKGHLTGVADWDYIRHLRDNLPPETVIFANGNILEHGDVERCLAATGADAVMSAEGNLSDPAIFARPPPVGQEGREYWRGACGSGSGDDGEAAAVVGGYRVDAVFRRYMDIMHRHVLGQEPPARRPLFVVGDDEAWLDETAGAETAGEEGPAKKKRKTDGNNNNNKSSNQSSKNNKAAANSNKQRTTSPNLGAMRPHLFHLLRHFVALHTDIRDSLARCRAGDVDAAEAVLDLVERRVARGLIDYERTGGESIRSYMQSTSKPAKPDPVAAAATAAVAAAVDAVPNDDNGVSNNTTKETNGTTTTNTDGTSSARQEQLPPPPPAHEAEGESSLETVRACKRPWWVCQPIVRPLPAEALAKGSIQLSKKQQKALSSTAATTPVASTAPAAAAAAALDTVANTLPKTDGVDSIAEPRMDPKQPGLVSDDLVCG